MVFVLGRRVEQSGPEGRGIDEVSERHCVAYEKTRLLYLDPQAADGSRRAIQSGCHGVCVACVQLVCSVAVWLAVQ